MESSHRRIVNELEEKHRQEIQRLVCDKEQALAEETQVSFQVYFFKNSLNESTNYERMADSLHFYIDLK